MRLEQNNKETFIASVYEFLLSICADGERIVVTRDILKPITIFTNTGISVLNIPQSSHIIPLYLEKPQDLIGELLKYPSFGNAFYIINLSRSNFDSISVNKETKLLYASELIQDKRLNFSKKEYRCKKTAITIGKIYKEKCLHVERFDEFLNYVIRCKIIFSIFRTDYNIDPSKISAKAGQQSVFPFIYEKSQIEICFLYEDKRQLNHPAYEKYFNDDRIIFYKISIKDVDDFNFLVKHTKLFNPLNDSAGQNIVSNTAQVEKVAERTLQNYIEVFNEVYGSFFIDEFIDLFKYRKFEKTRYQKEETIKVNDPSLYKYAESENIEVGSREALEKGTIWFSNYEQLNDPFDLVFRLPRKFIITPEVVSADSYKQITNHNFLTFCSTSRDDNILMWSHYGYSHTGICTGYSMPDIIKAIENDSTCGICFYGDIKYSSKRPTINLPYTLYRFFTYEVVVLWFNIISMFNKYIDWGYEKEFRFLILPNSSDSRDFNNGHGMVLPIKELSLGFSFPLNKYSNYLKNLEYSYKVFNVSANEYKLI